MNQEENIVFRKSSLTLEVAREMIKRAEEKAAETGIAITTCIVDESGVLKAFSRMDGSPLMAVDAARKKALTAAGIGLSTGKAWYDFIKDDPILLHGVQGITDFMLLGGGLPLRH
ncbi:MAG: heme-binding protein, partial [Bacteroidetes bacterium]|nr:heme-binding protein [Bacteroidota bacterium]